MTIESPTTDVQTDKTAPGTDADIKSSDTSTTPSFEQRDGKFYIDGNRVYTRDDTNRIASGARTEAEKAFLKDLDVDSLSQVKDVISTLKSSVKDDGGGTLDVKALQQAVAKREATVGELQNQVNELKTTLLLKDHIGNLNNAMPGSWTPDQKAAVVDLMKARNMFAIEGDSFQLKNGEDFLTIDGAKPDYSAAVELIGKTLGLSSAKKGVDVVNVNNGPSDDGKVKPLDESRLSTDKEYTTAYMHIRQFKSELSRSQITNNMVVSQMAAMRKQRS